MSDKNSSNEKPISFLWFVAGSIFCFFVGIPLTFNLVSEELSIFERLLGSLFLVPGFLLLLEPLHRVNLLPSGISRWYGRRDFSSDFGLLANLGTLPDSEKPKHSKVLHYMPLLFGPLVVLILMGEKLNRWPFVLFFAAVFTIQFLLGSTAIVAGRLKRLRQGRTNLTKTFARVESVAWSLLRLMATAPLPIKNVSIKRLIVSMGCQVGTFGAAFIVATQLPAGQVLGPALLAFIILSSAGTNVLFSEVTQERALFESELKTAHSMQSGLMPASDPIVEGFDISGVSKPSEEVGGDYFDYLWMNEEKTKLGIAIADVSGKAMKAAITAVMTSGMIYREIGNNQSPKEILKKINTPMFLKTQKNTFTAMSIAVIDTTAKTLTLSNAGQTHPILKRGETTQFLRVEGLRYPLGIIEEVEYQELTIPLQSGDLIVFYTDGIAEATNSNKELFGFDRLEQRIKQLTNETAKEVIQAIVGEAEKFAGSAKQHDDMTVVVVRVA